MQRAHFCALWGLGLMLAASSTRAGQVELSVEGRLGGDSNVFRSSADEKDDGTFDISPRLSARDANDDLDYAFSYQPTYRTFFRTSGIDGVDHNADARIAWEVSARDKLDFETTYYNGRQFLADSNAAAAGQPFTVNDRERLRIADTRAGYRRLLSQNLSLGVDGFFNDFDASGTDLQSQTDSRAYTGRVSVDYGLSPRLKVGLSGSGRRRENRAVGAFRVSTRTDVWDVMTSFSYSLSPTSEVSVQVGPSFIRQQQVPAGARDPNDPVGCTVVPNVQCERYPKDEEQDVTFFAAASANKRWRTSAVELSYVRTEARSGNTATSSSINDQVQLDGYVQLDTRWTLRGLFSWNRYDSIASDQSAEAGFTLINYLATETVEFALSPRVLLLGQYTFSRQETELDSVSGSVETDVHVGFVGVRYTFESLVY
jgi:hypothetical protein